MKSINRRKALVNLVKRGRNQVIHIPREFELPGNIAILRRAGNCLIIESPARQSLQRLFASWEPLPEGLPPFEDLAAGDVDL
jgi:antitoxin VapB